MPAKLVTTPTIMFYLLSFLFLYSFCKDSSQIQYPWIYSYLRKLKSLNHLIFILHIYLIFKLIRFVWDIDTEHNKPLRCSHVCFISLVLYYKGEIMKILECEGKKSFCVLTSVYLLRWLWYYIQTRVQIYISINRMFAFLHK